MSPLNGQTAIITGASGGIGSYISQALSRERMNLVLAGLSASALSELADKTSKTTGTMTIVVDVTKRRDLERLVEKTIEKFGTVDLLVNNAGIEMISRYHMLEPDDIERSINVNLTSAMVLTRLVLPGMLGRKRGHIVNISSLSAKAGPPCAESYTATKAALIAFTESLRAEYQGTGVSASVICPGFVTAGIYQRIFEETGFCAPRLLGTSSGEMVGLAVVRAIKKDIPEIIINRGPQRLLSAIAEFSPRLAERVVNHIGVVEWFMNVAKFRENKRANRTR